MTSVANAQSKPAQQEKVDSHEVPPPSGVTGDWGGVRTKLHDAGIDVAGSYILETASNFSGGDRRSVTAVGQLALGLTFDAERIAGITGGAFQATMTYRHGDGLSSDAGLGVLQQVQDIHGRGEAFRLTQFWYEQSLASDAVSLKLGRAGVGDDFADFSCYFMNLTFCGSAPGNLAGTYWYNWPISQWMARIRVRQGDTYAQAGVYEVNPRNLDEDFSLGRFNGATGVLVPVEFGWLPLVGRMGLPGSYKVGGWFSNAKGDDVFLDVNRDPRVITGLEPLRRSSRYGFWLDFWQQVYGTAVNGKAVSGVSVFLNFTQTDRETEITDNQIATGISWKAPFDAFPDDALAFAVGRTNVNGRYARGQALDPANPRRLTAEYAAEIYYSAHPFDWLELRPNLQFVRNPGGNPNAHSIGVLGLKAGVTL
jgi:porin